MLVAILFLLSSQSAQAADPAILKISPPASVVELDLGKLKGDFVNRLSWSPDGQQLYIQTIQRDRFGNELSKHYVVAASGGAPAGLDNEPSWASKYWSWKSAPAAPGEPTFKIAVEARSGRVSATATPMGGDLARGSPDVGGGKTSGLSPDEVAAVAMQSQNATTQTMRLNGEVVGEWVNAPLAPGTTFGWSPARLGLIAFTGTTGRLTLMNMTGQKRTIEGVGGARLPAWTDDGKRIAFLKQTGRKRLTLQVVEVGVR